MAFARFRYCGTYCGGREGSQAEICPAACDNFMKACFADAMPSNPSSSLPSVWSQLISKSTHISFILNALPLPLLIV